MPKNTMTKSIRFHPLAKYFLTPSAISSSCLQAEQAFGHIRDVCFSALNLRRRWRSTASNTDDTRMSKMTN